MLLSQLYVSGDISLMNTTYPPDFLIPFNRLIATHNLLRCCVYYYFLNIKDRSNEIIGREVERERERGRDGEREGEGGMMCADIKLCKQKN